MDASILDLRYKMKEVLKALSRREKVRILFHGKEKGVIIPVDKKSGQSVKAHPFFGMDRKANHSVDEVVEGLRGGRYNAL
jgi:hypothetical protein